MNLKRCYCAAILSAAGVFVAIFLIHSKLFLLSRRQESIATVSPRTSSVNQVTNGTLSTEDEIASVLRRLNTCLIAANMSEYFSKMNYEERAAKHFFSVLRSVIPKTFSNKFNSPCWRTEFQVRYRAMSTMMSSKLGNQRFSSDVSHTFHHHIPKLLKKLRGKFSSNVVCLPKLFIAGFPKCGSTFLYCLLTDWLQYEAQSKKEPRWWVPAGAAVSPHTPTPEDIPVYLMNFAPAARILESKIHDDAITIDASPNLLFDWPRFNAEKQPVNYCLLPAVIPQVLPHSQFVVIMRNPIEMLYSAFWFSCTTFGIKVSNKARLNGPNIFHERVLTKINQFNYCLRRNSLEWCVINITYNLFSPELQRCGNVRMEIGFYYVHINKWLSVTPRENFMFLTLEELYTGQDAVAKRFGDFLGIDISQRNSTCDKNEQHLIDYHHDNHLQMRRDTKELLRSFYRPFNQRLARLIGDSKFLWDT